MMDYNLRIGLVPVRRDVTPRPGIFNWEKAEARGRLFTKRIEEAYSDDRISFSRIDGINKEDLLYSENDVPKAVEMLKAEKVDAVFIINCNFGNEEAVGQLCKAMGVPVLLWGPLDDEFAPDGMRYTDSQCGCFGISRQLQRRGIPFSYIVSCAFEDPEFEEGFRRFCSAACMVKNFRGMRIASVGCRPKPFCSVMFNESELMEKFDIQVIPVNLAVAIDKYSRILKERDAELEEGAKIFTKRAARRLVYRQVVVLAGLLFRHFKTILYPHVPFRRLDDILYPKAQKIGDTKAGVYSQSEQRIVPDVPFFQGRFYLLDVGFCPKRLDIAHE